MVERVEAVLDERVRPLLRAHGGGVEVAALEDGVLYLRLLGACAGCPAADLSTREMIVEILREELPQIRETVLEHSVDRALLDVARSILRGEPCLEEET